jgi:ABC-type transporter lipoprotein component MlaA
VDSWEATLSLRVVNLLDQRRRLLDATKTGKESSLDYYEFVKSTYHQYRQNLIYDGEVPEEQTGGEPAE